MLIMENLRELKSNELSTIKGGIVWIPLAIKAGKVIAGILTAAAAVDAGRDFACGMNEGLSE